MANNAEPSHGSLAVYPIEWNGSSGETKWLFERGSAFTHTLSVEAEDNCGIGGGFTTAHFTITNVSFDVIGVR